MKKLLLVFALLLASRASFAAYASGGNILQSQTKYNTSTGYLTLDVDMGSSGGFTLVSGTAYIGAVGISGTALAALTTTTALTANLSGAYLSVSTSTATGVTTNAAVTRSLTFVASAATGILDPNLVGCAGATTVYYRVHDGVTPPAYFTANPSQGSAFLCGTTELILPRRFMGANPHITFYAAGLSATSATVSFELLSRTAQ